MNAAGVQEHLLVREVLHCCQGIDGGRYIWYQNDANGSGGFACGPEVDVSPAQRQLISRITELGWLLKRVKDLTDKISNFESIVHEALMAACNKEISNCYRLIAILEAQCQQSSDPSNSASGQLSLRRLIVWTSEPLQRLRVVSSCLEATVSLRGGQVINALHAMSKHGDPLVRHTIAPLLEEACIPYFKLIARWVLDGTLDTTTTNDDFMIRSLASSDFPDANTIWNSNYTINTAMQPSFMSRELAEQVLTAGKTVAFLRQVCGDSEWAALMSGTSITALEAQGGTYQRLEWLQAAIKDVNTIVGVRLLDIILHREHLLTHLHTIKRFLLHSQGDFVRSLIDLAGSDLEKHARDLSVYSLQGYVDVALRSCGAASSHTPPSGMSVTSAASTTSQQHQHHYTVEELQKKVQIKLQRPLEGDTGWDIFGLTYSVDGPSVAVLSAESMTAYNRVSRLLWMIKRAEHAVASSWHQLNDVSHTIAALHALRRQHGIEDVAMGVPAVLRYVQSRRADMEQFVTALQSHVSYEVLEPAWRLMMTSIQAATNMEGLIVAHENALASILKGTFLDDSARTVSGSVLAAVTSSAAEQKAPPGAVNTSSDTHAALRATLRSVLDVQGPVRRLTEAVNGALEEQRAYLQRAKESEAEGEWNREVYDSPAGIGVELLTEIRSAMWRVHIAFDRHLKVFISLLPPSSHLGLSSLSSRLESLEG